MTALNPFATAAIVALCAVGSPHMAQAAEPETQTLACQGTVTNNIKPDAKPEQITMGIVVNFTAQTVAGFTYPGLEEFPVVIRAASEVLIARLTVLRCTLGGSLCGFTFGPSGRLRLPRAAAKDSGAHELT